MIIILCFFFFFLLKKVGFEQKLGWKMEFPPPAGKQQHHYHFLEINIYILMADRELVNSDLLEI